MNYTDNWRSSERERLLNRKEPREREAEAVEDRANCIGVLARNARTVQDVLASIDNMFGDATDENSIILSSVHRAKGLEANRVFILLRSFRIPRAVWGEPVYDSKSQEELNIAYVAITRAKEELYYVVD
jgi:superfamily I DNA/RNA helicase